MKVNRNRTGAALSFVVVASLFLVIVGVAFAFLVALLSGSRQGTNANDAGNLNELSAHL
jgi:Flp pilus assembly protein TadG